MAQDYGWGEREWGDIDKIGIDVNLSEKDTKHAMLKDFDSPFDIKVDLYGHE